MSSPANKNLSGIGLMVLAMLLFQAMDAMAKWLVLDGMSAIQVIAFRSWIMLPVILLILGLSGNLRQLRTTQPGFNAMRGMLAFFAPFLYFSALKTVPIADAAVVFFAATFILTAASALIFKEQVGIHRWSAVVIGFVGVVIAMNPQGGGAIGDYLMVLGSTTIYAITFLMGKHLSRQSSVISMVFSLNLGMGVIATALLPWVWTPVSLLTVFKLLIMTMIALIAHYAITASFSRAEVSLIAPFEYTALVWAVALGYFFWQEIPGNHVWTGAAIIVLSGLYVIHRETRRREVGG